MLISENSRRSRPTVLYSILARSALDQLVKHDDEFDRSAYFQNLVRLLDLYRSNTLHRPTPKAVLDRRPIDVRSLQRERIEADTVQKALTKAHETAFPEMSKHEFIAHLSNIFQKIEKHDAGEISAKDLDRAKTFLAALVDELKQ